MQEGGLDVNGDTQRPTYIGLVHELAHAHDAISDNRMDQGVWFIANSKPVANSEKYATHIENQIRAENNIPLRAYYGQRVGEGHVLGYDNVSSIHYDQVFKRTYTSEPYNVQQTTTITTPFLYGSNRTKFK